ncbi:MAG: homoserine O-acetyltransferase [Candidatus Methylacidiphilales bacterium]
MPSSPRTVRTRFFRYEDPRRPLKLRVGERLPEFTLAYETYGRLNQAKSNAVLVFHAMTGSQHAAGYNPHVPGTGGLWTEEMHDGWWEGFIGPGRALDTRHLFIICANYLGGCYGSTGPTSLNPKTGQPYGRDFPPIRIADIADSQIRLLDHLGIRKLRAVIGGSIGGLLSLSLATRYPARVERVIPIASGLETTVVQRILNFEQINAIEADPKFLEGRYPSGQGPSHGLALARRIAHKTFVSPTMLSERAKQEIMTGKPPFGWYEMNHPVESYMLHQGQKFIRRFDANSYLRILDAWQWFDLVAEAGAPSLDHLLTRCRHQHFLVFTIDSDVSFHPSEQAKLVKALKQADVPVTWITVHSDKGHDSFLLEPRLFAPHVRQILLGEKLGTG